MDSDYKRTLESQVQEHDAAYPAGSMKLDDEIVQSAFKRIIASDACKQVIDGRHEWTLNMELSANVGGTSLLLPLSEFKFVIVVADNVPWEVGRKSKITDALAASKNKSLLFAMIAMLDALEIHSPQASRLPDHPDITQFIGNNHVLALRISAGLLVIL